MKFFKKLSWCSVGIHKSDRDFGIRWHDKAVLSHCVRCNKTIVHKRMWVSGGGNY